MFSPTTIMTRTVCRLSSAKTQIGRPPPRRDELPILAGIPFGAHVSWKEAKREKKRPRQLISSTDNHPTRLALRPSIWCGTEIEVGAATIIDPTGTGARDHGSECGPTANLSIADELVLACRAPKGPDRARPGTANGEVKRLAERKNVGRC
uniref:Uncharacterized protein n=1 Tax=Anopheles coluzzii TaxID=1518534 RepID=A0A8W7PH19_ANOCL